MKPLANQPLLAASMSCAVMLLTGCKTIVRENIVSSINTGIGATITENPKTELYEVKLGFIRTQFYSIPTGKNVEGTAFSNAADLTPEVVSGIRAHSGIEHLFIGMDVSESFAVGKIAVESDAATAMYIANAKSETAANAAAIAVNPAAKEYARKFAEVQIQASDEVLAQLYAENGKLDTEKLRKAIQGTSLEGQFDRLSRLTKDQFRAKLRRDWRDMAQEMNDNLKK